VRRWEYRQRNHSKGVWVRLRRTLAEAARAWTIPESVAEQLLAEGHVPEPVGAELEPPKLLFFLPSSRIDTIPERRPLRLRLDAELLGARRIILERI
jgi:hypothetical protein